MNSKVVKLDCSFCGKNQTDPEVFLLVTGPGVNICSKCVEFCVMLVKEHRESGNMISLLVEENPEYGKKESQ